MFKRATVALAAVFVLAASSFSQTPSAGAEKPREASFEQRLGPDDGAALAILFGANMRGNLDLCD